jgi:SAM-dependent methyltransferase
MTLKNTIKPFIPPLLISTIRRFAPFVKRDLISEQRRLLKRICLALVAGNSYMYEPAKIGDQYCPGQRDVEIRWTAIQQELRKLGPGSFLDIGCAEGWFVRRAAEDCGYFAVGLEMSMPRLLLGETSRLHDAAQNYATIRAMLTPEKIPCLPVFDVVCCLSVVHHIIYKEGLDRAAGFVRALGSRTAKLLIFEMGTSEETNMRGAHQMPPMPDGQEAFIARFLASAGYTSIRNIATTLSNRGIERILFAATPNR